jgi:hypothetical protein
LAVKRCGFLLVAGAFPRANGVFVRDVFSCVVWFFEGAVALEVA